MSKKKIAVFTLALAVLVGGYLAREPVRAAWQQRQQGRQAAAPDEHAGHTLPTGERKVLYWYDPMHPAYKSDKPGIAPDCGMQLVPKYADEVEGMKAMPAGTVMIPPEKQQLIGVRTGTVERKRLTRSLRAVGKVTYDETKLAHVHTKVTGYIEEVFVDFVGKVVKQGDPLFTIYSPELVSTQQEYLTALRAQTYLKDAPYREVVNGAESLVKAARERLRLWDVREAEIETLEKEGQVKRALTMYSPVSGVVTERAAYHHGRYVTPETDLYTIIDLSTVWVLADIYEYEVPYVKAGQPATMRLSYYPGKSYAGKVTYVYPSVEATTRTVKARLEFPNPEFELKPDMFAEVELQIDYGTQVVVPQDAVLDSGSEQIVFLPRAGGYFEPRKIKIGARVGDQIVVLAGLRPGEAIVISGNFLIDSESRLKSAMAGMQH